MDTSDDLSELSEIDIDEVHLVGQSANGFGSPLLAKSANAGAARRNPSVLLEAYEALKERQSQAELAAKAVAGGPARRSMQTPMMQSYLYHLSRLQAVKEAEKTPAEIEEHALKKSLKRAAKGVARGDARDKAFAAGFLRYKKYGGKLGLQSWLRRVR